MVKCETGRKRGLAGKTFAQNPVPVRRNCMTHLLAGSKLHKDPARGCRTEIESNQIPIAQCSIPSHECTIRNQIVADGYHA